MKKVYFATGFVALTLLTACGNASQSAPTQENATHADKVQQAGQASHQQHAKNGDLQETTASIVQLPSFLDKVDPKIKSIYRIAGDNNDLLANIPCYCGCGESADHKHNGNCFIKEVKSDGSVVWDDHGTRCGTCMEIAFTSAKMKQEGKTIKEIREFIDNKYKKGYAPPTLTPMPS